jgi:predicted NBD/HSP70 family sugar kinase
MESRESSLGAGITIGQGCGGRMIANGKILEAAVAVQADAAGPDAA